MLIFAGVPRSGRGRGASNTIHVRQLFSRLAINRPRYYQCVNCRRVGGLNPPVHFFNPQFDLFVCLGGQKITPQIALVYTVCAVIALAQFLSRHLSKILYQQCLQIGLSRV